MNSQELVLTACAFQKPGRIPRFDGFWEYPDAWREQLGPPEDLTDIAIWVPDETTFPSRAHFIEKSGDWIYEVDGWGRVIRQKKGAYFSETLAVPLPAGEDPETVSFDSPALAARYLQGFSSETEMLSVLAQAKARHCVFGKTGGPYLRTTFVRGETQFLMDIAADPGLAKALADKMGAHLAAVGAAEIQRWSLQATGMWIYDDMAHNGGAMFSPESFEKIFLPAYRGMIKTFKDAGARYVFLHSDGDIRALLDMLIDAGIDGINPLERRAHMDAAVLRQRYPRLVLTGGMCNTDTLVKGPIAKIQAEARELIDLGRDGGLVIGTHSVSPEIPRNIFPLMTRFAAYMAILLPIENRESLKYQGFPLPAERQILRRLAEQVAEIAALPIQTERAALWQAMNKLHPSRPLVLADPQNGWGELVPESALECCHPLLRGWELSLRRSIFRHQFIHDDWPITNTLDVHWEVDVGGYGLQETQVRSEAKGSYTWEAPLKTADDVEKLHPRQIVVNHVQTDFNMALAQGMLGDLLSINRMGEAMCRVKLTRVLIHLRGLQQMMLDMYDNPPLLHHLMAFLRDDFLHEWQIYEQEGVLTLNNRPDSVMGSGSLGHTSHLPAPGYTGQARMQDMWCWGESQETVGVGPQQFDEFVLQYQLPLMNRFGLVDYGCCEPLDNKFDLLIKHIPRLHSVAVSPWCNRRIAATKLGDRYVYVWKPNPSLICSPQPNFTAAEQDIRDTLKIARGCNVVVVMKDTSTFHNEPWRITHWTDLASRLCRME